MANAKWFNSVTVDKVIAAYRKLDYPLCVNGDYNLNIFGIRNEDDKDSNTFNDVIGLLYKVNGEWVLKKFDATTDPGTKARLNPINSKGCAILVPGYYKSAFRIGKHKGQYEALVQNTALPLYRDNNKDSKLDFVNAQDPEVAGINLHRATANAGGKSTYVDMWSCGCQVVAANADFTELMKLVKQSSSIYGSTFSYALFTSSQVI